MKFLIDAQLPHRLARELTLAGHDTLHTLELARGNRTPDDEIAAHASREGRVLMTKDSDFVTMFLLHQMPSKLLLISTGNIANDALTRLIIANLAHLEATFGEHDFVELGPAALTIHA